MAEARRNVAPPMLQVSGLNVYYGRSHALQGVDLAVQHGVMSVVGRNGMGKTTLCKTIMGLVHASSGSVRMANQDLLGLQPAQIARLGVGYVPQGRRLWRSLTVDEHLRLSTGRRRGAWSVERIYDTFPRLAERKNNGGGQLSGGEQQMLAISRALLANPQLLIMDEPTEGLAPVIVSQVEEMLIRLGEEGDMAILVIEQNIGVATAISDKVAIMVNGRINRIVESSLLANDRELQQRLLGVGRHSEASPEDHEQAAMTVSSADTVQPQRRSGPTKIYVSNPVIPNRWSQPVSTARIEAAARVVTGGLTGSNNSAGQRSALTAGRAAGQPIIIVAGTLDTKGPELRFIQDMIKSSGLRTRLVDVSTSGKISSCDVTAQEIALHHRRGGPGVFNGERGQSVTAMAEAFEVWIKRQPDIAGIISAGGSGGASLVAPAMRALPVGVPKMLISSVASGDVGRYVGPADIAMMYSVTDVQGINSISRQVLANGANALVGMVKARLQEDKETYPTDRLAIGLTMFGVTTPAVQQIAAELETLRECLVFHATGVGGQSMEKLIDSGLLSGVIDLTTTEIADMLFGGVFAATPDRFGAIIRSHMPYIGSVGALDMVNFGAMETIPASYRTRKLHVHNPQVTLMRTTIAENEAMGRWIGERLNQMDAPVRFFLPEGGISALDAPGQPFYDPDADAALFRSLRETVRQTSTRQLITVPQHINHPDFAKIVATAFRELHGVSTTRKRAAR